MFRALRRAPKPALRTPGLRRFARDRRANVAMIFALTAPLVIAGIGFGVDTGYWYYRQLSLQQAADAAAYAGGVVDRAGGASSAILSAATYSAQQNGWDTTTGTITLNTPPTSGTHENDRSVEVILTRNEQRFFSQLFSSATVTTRARAVATFINASDACVLALDKIVGRSADFSGSSNTTLTGCSVMSNSLASDAVYIQGSTQLTTPCVLSAGGVQTNSGLTLTGSTCSAPITNLPPVADPLASLPEPAVTGTCQSTSGNSLSPGRYCGGLTLNGATTTLAAGVYIIDGGTLKMNGNGTVSGSGVTFFLANNATVQMNGNPTVTLSAPTSGTYSGILFFGARENTYASNTFNGNTGSSMTGDLYFASGEVDYNGNFSGANGCTHVVADVVNWTGSATLGVDCTGHGMGELQVAQPVKLVE